MTDKLYKKISRFRYEDMCSTGINTIPISTVCNAKCLFCSNKMNPFPIYRCGFRPVREVREWLSCNKLGLDNNPSFRVQLSDVLPGRISEGEATLHPQFFDILQLLRSALRNCFHMTTNGSKLTEKFVSELAKYKPFKVMVSYHSCNPDHWTSIFGLSRREYDLATRAFKLLNNAGIETVGAIVALPNMVGYKDIEETMMFFNEHCSRIQFWRPSYSKYADDEIIKVVGHDASEFKDFVHGMYKKCDNLSIRWDTDPDLPLTLDPYDLMIHTVKMGYKKVMWMTAEINYERLKVLIADVSKLFPNEHYVEKIVSHAYGGNTSCNGLLLVSDINIALDETKYNPDAVVLSNKFLDRPGRDLTEVAWTNIRSPAPIILEDQ